LLEKMHWRLTFVLFGAVGLFWVISWWVWFRDDPHRHSAVNQAELRLIGTSSPAAHGAVPWAALFRNRTMVAMCIMYLSAIYGWYFYITWLPTYLLRARGFDLVHAGWLSALPLLSIALGVLAGGWVSDPLTRRWGSRAGRRAPALLGLPLAAGAIVAAVLSPDPYVAALCLAAAAGLAALAVAPAWAVCLEVGGAHAGTVSGTMNMFGNLGGALSPVVTGWCLQTWGSWDAPLFTVALGYGVAALCWLFIDPQAIAAHGAPAAERSR
jgi:nitrate/nitrite transporter NarK